MLQFDLGLDEGHQSASTHPVGRTAPPEGSRPGATQTVTLVRNAG